MWQIKKKKISSNYRQFDNYKNYNLADCPGNYHPNRKKKKKTIAVIRTKKKVEKINR